MRSDRPRSRGSSRRVALFVDYGGLLECYGDDESPDLESLTDHLRSLTTALGRVTAATAYADWTNLGEDAQAFRRRGIEPRLVLTAESGDDRSDVVLALDALEVALTVHSVGVFVIASVDGGLHDLVVRLRRSGREVVVCGPRDEMPAELARDADRFVAFEGFADAPAAKTPGTEPTGIVARPAVDFESYDWGRFLQLVGELESRLSFVGLKYLNHKVLNRENCGFEDRPRRQALINHAIDSGILEIYQIDNIEAGGDPVTACRLNRAHELVLERLGEAAAAEPRTAPEKAPSEPEPPAEPEA